LTHEGRTLLESQLLFLTDLFDPASIAVSIQEPWLDRCRCLDARVRWVPVDPDLPAMAALLALMSASPLDQWAFLHHVDMPVWEEGLFRALSDRVPIAEAVGTEAVVPVEGGKGGHPVLLSPALGEALGGLDASKDRLDLWLATRKVKRVELPFPCIHENWNTVA